MQTGSLFKHQSYDVAALWYVYFAVDHDLQTDSVIELFELPGNVCWGYSSWATMVVFHSRVRVEEISQPDTISLILPR
jgi:hypothetical protein